MPSISPSHYLTIKKMYSSGATMATIANYFNVPINAVVYAMRKGKISRRSPQQARALRFEQQKPSFEIRVLKNESQRIIENTAVALYWAEGYKTQKASGVDFANSDPSMIIGADLQRFQYANSQNPIFGQIIEKEAEKCLMDSSISGMLTKNYYMIYSSVSIS